MIEKLKKLGLTGYEAQAYLALCKLGDAEANEIAMDAKIPMGRIYNVLSSLEEAGLIRTQETRPKRYACVEPAASMERLTKIKHEELQRASAELQTLADDLASELSVMKMKKTAKTFWTVAIGDESNDLIRECIIGARQEILYFMASQPTSERIKKEVLNSRYTEIIGQLLGALTRGVKVKFIFNDNVDFRELVDYPIIKQLLAYSGDVLDFRLAAVPVTPFDIIDREIITLKMQNPLDPEELFAVVNIRDTTLAEELRKKFFAIWDGAEPFSLSMNE